MSWGRLFLSFYRVSGLFVLSLFLNLIQKLYITKTPGYKRLKLPKFMFKLEHNKLPKLFNNNFIKNENIDVTFSDHVCKTV